MKGFLEAMLEEIILFSACIFSFAAVLISFLFFFRYKKIFFLHVLLILFSFFMISTNNLYAVIHNPLVERIPVCIFGAFLSLFFSFGIISFTLDLIQISRSATVRKFIAGYSILNFIFSFILIFITLIQKPAFILNLIGLWIPTGFSIILSIIFFKRIDTGVFRKEKWIILILAALNLVLSFVLHNAPFIFIISISVLIYHIFYRFYFSSPISKTEKTLKEDFIKDFGITKREQEIIVALLHGKSNKELAETLFVSEKTIETHLANIYRKVGVKNRLELFSRLQND